VTLRANNTCLSRRGTNRPVYALNTHHSMWGSGSHTLSIYKLLSIAKRVYPSLKLEYLSLLLINNNQRNYGHLLSAAQSLPHLGKRVLRLETSHCDFVMRILHQQKRTMIFLHRLCVYESERKLSFTYNTTSKRLHMYYLISAMLREVSARATLESSKNTLSRLEGLNPHFQIQSTRRSQLEEYA
jgi:hypothetical protein